ncbi:MAG: hypothetical protein U5L11_17605 [Arhodomonas sp.]|nr:hypothetical protein [Arhodomonas sp.]
MVLAFNPVSLWGLRRVLGVLGAGEPPWAGHYFGRLRINDWLRLLGLAIERREGVFCRPPVARARTLEWLAPLERLGPGYARLFGGVTLTVAQKHVAGMTPLLPEERPRLKVIDGGLAGASRVRAGDAARTAHKGTDA